MFIRKRKSERKLSKQFSERGIALLVVSVSLSIIMLLTAEFGTNTTIDYYTATNARDNVRAEFLARSGQNLAKLIIRVQTDLIDKYRRQMNLGDLQLADYTGLFMSAFGGSKKEMNDLAQGFGITNTNAIKGLGLDGGEFDVTITTDDGKINLNCARGGSRTRQTLRTKLEALFYFDAFNPIFESKTADGWQRDRAQQVAALIDYIDEDHSKYNAPGASEDDDYQTLKDRFNPKNNYIDTVGEIKLIRGVDDRFWTLFGGQFTAYGDCRENVSAIQDPKLVAAIIFLTAKNAEDPVLRDMNKLWALARRVVEARGMGVMFDNINTFRDYVKNPDGALQSMLESRGLPSDPNAQQMEGVELDTNKLNQIAYAGPRRIYRIVSEAKAGVLHTKITAVWDTQVTPQNSRDPMANPKGAYLFWKER